MQLFGFSFKKPFYWFQLFKNSHSHHVQSMSLHHFLRIIIHYILALNQTFLLLNSQVSLHILHNRILYIIRFIMSRSPKVLKPKENSKSILSVKLSDQRFRRNAQKKHSLRKKTEKRTYRTSVPFSGICPT